MAKILLSLSKNNKMTFEEFMQFSADILKTPLEYPSYNETDILHYIKMNVSRANRWLKKFEPHAETLDFIQKISGKQKWIVITEPWCGDAAHSVPQLYKIASLNPSITFEIQLRDTEPSLINDYLTNGGKAIPILIIRDDEDNDLLVWGPRPTPATELFVKLKNENMPFEQIKEEMQKWYNDDKGEAIQKDLIDLLG